MTQSVQRCVPTPERGNNGVLDGKGEIYRSHAPAWECIHRRSALRSAESTPMVSSTSEVNDDAERPEMCSHAGAWEQWGFRRQRKNT